MTWYIPREHGAWAMLIVPFWIGASISQPTWSHVVLFLGFLAVYFAQAPLLNYLRNPKHKDVWPSFFVYVVIGLTIIIPFLIRVPELLIICFSIAPLFLVNLYFAKTKQERLFINDLCAITALSGLLLISYRLNEPALQPEAFLYMVVCILFYTASVFHVKSLIREKKNETFKKRSLYYHIFIIICSIALQLIGVAIAFFITFLKMKFLPIKYLRTPKHIGIVEVINSVIFIILVITFYYI
ncbi:MULTISPECIES: YwiC-like family protein [Bacillaceae]|uniref:YwiC-like family protein n=1 Tax=Evansella alkalicola TaxID=745819 RepID=A0ABS6JU77_9BACI|nr:MULTISPECIES: YwiC-like family protein [Bacillaceae]MBU9721807.1 YwiC-like family protein [Bacillus alkalicola]